jgi:chloramphenicol 3-O-phosphotransferase
MQPAADSARSAPLYLITGIQAAGKSTVAQALAEQLPAPSVHVHGDQFRRWIVNGQLDMTPNAGPEAIAQLHLRYRLTAAACELYSSAGLSVVAQDVILGAYLQLMVDMLRTRPLHVIVLAPRPEVVAHREWQRSKDSYDRWTVDVLDHGLRHDTPRLGLWLDTSDHTVQQTVEEILQRSPEALITN